MVPLPPAPLHTRSAVSQSDVPVWNPDNCIQCNFCSYVCPHAVIRPVAMTEEEAAKAPADMKIRHPMTGMPRIQVRYDHLRSGLYRMRLLCKRMPRHEGQQGSGR